MFTRRSLLKLLSCVPLLQRKRDPHFKDAGQEWFPLPVPDVPEYDLDGLICFASFSPSTIPTIKWYTMSAGGTWELIKDE